MQMRSHLSLQRWVIVTTISILARVHYPLSVCVLPDIQKKYSLCTTCIVMKHVVIFNIFNYTTMSESVCLVCQSLNIYIALFFEITQRITAKICFLCTTCIVMQYIFIYYIILKYLTTQRFQRPVSTTFSIPSSVSFLQPQHLFISIPVCLPQCLLRVEQHMLDKIEKNPDRLEIFARFI